MAANADSRIVEIWQCKVNEGKTMDDVATANGKWLAFVRKVVADGDVNSYGVESVVGDSTSFMYVDSFPSMEAWIAVKAALDSPEGEALEAELQGNAECTNNSLHKSTAH
jgi:hypothetical protein